MICFSLSETRTKQENQNYSVWNQPRHFVEEDPNCVISSGSSMQHATTYLKSYHFYHEYREASLTQYLSIISSLLLMTKSSFELLSYQRIEDPLDDENKSTKEKIMEVLRIFVSYLSFQEMVFLEVP